MEAKMKRQAMIVFFMVLILISGVHILNGNFSKDYKVIKKAVKGKKATKDVAYFKILVVDKINRKVKIRLTLPITLVELLSECTDDTIKIKNHCRVDFKAIFKELKKLGPHCLIEIDSGDESVKIWFE
jgi:hypothetical protein